MPGAKVDYRPSTFTQYNQGGQSTLSNCNTFCDSTRQSKNCFGSLESQKVEDHAMNWAFYELRNAKDRRRIHRWSSETLAENTSYRLCRAEDISFKRVALPTWTKAADRMGNGLPHRDRNSDWRCKRQRRLLRSCSPSWQRL